MGYFRPLVALATVIWRSTLPSWQLILLRRTQTPERAVGALGHERIAVREDRLPSWTWQAQEARRLRRAPQQGPARTTCSEARVAAYRIGAGTARPTFVWQPDCGSEVS